MFFQPGRVVSASIRHAVNAQATGLWIVTGVVAAAVVTALGFVITSFVRLTTASRQSLRAVGYTSVQATGEEVAAAATLIVAGTVAAVVLAALASVAFPRGFARAVEPDPGHLRADPLVLAGGAIAMAVLLLAWVAVATRITRRQAATAHPSAVADALSRTGVVPEANLGVRFALSRDGRERFSSAATIAALCFGVAAVVGTLVFGASLSRLVGDSARYGYNFDYVAGNPTGGPLDPSVMDAARTAPGVRGAMALSQGSAPVAGEDIDLVGVEPLRGGLLPVVLAGRFPASSDEVAVGKLTAEALRIRVGDEMTFDGEQGSVAYHVVGVVVLPSVSFGEGGGRGAAMLQSGLQRVSADSDLQQLAIRLEPGTKPDALSLGADVNPSSGLSRPPDVINASRSRSVPVIIAVVVGVLATVVLVQALISSVRSRRRDVAILRALGADRGWVTRVVHIQATALGFAALAIGIPLGIVAGRAIFRAFAGNLGLVATPAMPVVIIASVAATLLVMANVAASVPAHRARHIPLSTLLRNE
jgi:ABC-type lipoprotein release transport system permease subunit